MMNVKLAEFDAALLFDGFDRVQPQVGFRVRDGHGARHRQVAKLMMAANDTNLVPARGGDLLDDFPALHTHSYTHYRRNGQQIVCI